MSPLKIHSTWTSLPALLLMHTEMDFKTSNETSAYNSIIASLSSQSVNQSINRSANPSISQSSPIGASAEHESTQFCNISNVLDALEHLFLVNLMEF